VTFSEIAPSSSPWLSNHPDILGDEEQTRNDYADGMEEVFGSIPTGS
jgi:hypothetical protein